MIFHVLDKEGNVDGSRDWVITQDGELRALVEGWGCEGGGGSEPAPNGHIAVFGLPPDDEQTEIQASIFEKNVKCSCGKKFMTDSALEMHRAAKGCM